MPPYEEISFKNNQTLIKPHQHWLINAEHFDVVSHHCIASLSELTKSLIYTFLGAVLHCSIPMTALEWIYTSS